VVIGEVIGTAGVLAPLSYALAALVAVTTASAYAELGARLPTAGGPIDYIEEATDSWWLGTGVGWALLAAQIVSAATITTGFIDYLGVFVSVPDWTVAVALVSALAGVAVVGSKESAWFMGITTSIGLVTLGAVVWATSEGIVAGVPAIFGELSSPGEGSIRGLFAGAFLAVYSFIGFGDMAMTAEETKDVQTTLPRAILGSLVFVLICYLLVSLALVGTVEVAELADAEAPLVAATVAQGWPQWPVAIGSLFVIVNGALTQIVTGSRILLDLGRDGRGVPSWLGHVWDRTDTPAPATAVVAAVVLFLAVVVPLQALAEATSFVILVVFAAVNASLVVLKGRGQPDEVPDVPRVLPMVGAVLCVGALVGQVVLRVTGG
jgi:amino acid transporter